jgi:hypothetical protein
MSEVEELIITGEMGGVRLQLSRDFCENLDEQTYEEMTEYSVKDIISGVISHNYNLFKICQNRALSFYDELNKTPR